MKMKQPTCYVIAGANGAGKTTFAMQYLPGIVECRDFLNTDLIALGLSPLDARRVEIEAGRIFLQHLERAIGRGESFAFETTLSGRGYLKTFKRVKDANFEIMIFYLWVSGSAFAVQRVLSRVKNGGHDIPNEVVIRRYTKSLHNFFHLYMPLSDRTLLFDNSQETPTLILDVAKGEFHVMNENRYNLFHEEVRRTDDAENRKK